MGIITTTCRSLGVSLKHVLIGWILLSGSAIGEEELNDVDVALDSALEAFPEEELVQRDQVVSLMANFKTALARAKEAETRVRQPLAAEMTH